MKLELPLLIEILSAPLQNSQIWYQMKYFNGEKKVRAKSLQASYENRTKRAIGFLISLSLLILPFLLTNFYLLWLDTIFIFFSFHIKYWWQVSRDQAVTRWQFQEDFQLDDPAYGSGYPGGKVCLSSCLPAFFTSLKCNWT